MSSHANMQAAFTIFIWNFTDFVPKGPNNSKSVLV